MPSRSGSAVPGEVLAFTTAPEGRHEPIEAVKLRLSEALAGLVEPLDILATAAAMVGRRLGVSRVAYGEIQPGSDRIFIPTDWTDGVETMVGEHPLHRGTGFVREYMEGRTLAVDDIDTLDLIPAERTMLNETACQSCISVPLVRDGELIALFSATHRHPRRWSEDEIALVDHAAARTWSALEHSRISARLRESEATLVERDRAQTFLIDWSDRVRHQTTPEAIIAITLERLADHYSAAHAWYGATEDDGATFAVADEWRRAEASFIGTTYRLEDRTDPLTMALRSGGLVQIADAQNDPVLSEALRQHCRRMGVGSFATTALIRDGRLYAILTVTDTRPRVCTPEEGQLLREVAERMWAILEKARAEAALQERERHQAFLLDWSDAVRDEASPAAIIALTTARLAAHLGASRSSYAATLDNGATFTIVGEATGDANTVSGETYTLDRLGAAIADELRAGRMTRSDDVQADDRATPGLRGFYRRHDIGADMSMPLTRHGRIRGILSVTQRGPRRWAESEIRLMEDIAGRMCVILEKAQAEAALQARERHQAFLLDWSDGARGLTDPDAIAEFTVSRLGRYLGTSRVNFAEVNAGGTQFSVRREWFADGRIEMGRAGISEGVHAAYLSGDVVVVEDVTADARFDDHARERYLGVEAASFLAARMGEAKGYLSVQDARPRRWHQFEIQLLRDIAERSWALMERARVAATLAARERDQAFLIAWTDALRTESDAGVILETTLERLGKYLGATRVCHSEITVDDGNYTIVAEWRRGTVAVRGLVFPSSTLSPFVRRTYLSGQALVSDDLARDTRFSAAALEGFTRAEVGARISVPLARDGFVRAILAVDTKRPRRWQDREVDLVRDVSDRMWTHMERARVETDLKERERHQAAILAWNDRMRDERTAWGMLTATLDHLGSTLGATRINYSETGEDGETLHVVQEWRSDGASVIGTPFPLDSLGARVRAAHETGQPVVVNDIAGDKRFDAGNRPMYEAIGIAALLSIAMVRDGRIIAVLSIQQDVPRAWTPGDVQLLADLAERTWALLERRRSEERLNESEALLAAFMENAPIAMFLKDEGGRYVRINREMAVVLGCEIGEAIGRLTGDFLPPDAAQEAAKLDRLALGGGIHASEVDLGPRERYASALSVRFCVPGLDGRSTRLGGFVIDLTERREAEAALERSRASLYQTEKLSALGSLLAGVSHELNNPLSIVVAQAVMLERATGGTPLADRAQKIRKAADRCARIVQTFLAMARQKRPERKPVDLNDVARAAMELTGYGLKVDGIALDLQLADGLPQIFADADQLHQVIVNLVVNAQHALADLPPEHERRVAVRTRPGVEPRTVILEVADSGPGVPPEARRRIFEPFFTTKPQGQGTGVGLSFSQGLVEAHGGRLALVPSARGAVFRATLPIERDQTLPPMAPEAHLAAPETSKRALVIDDESEIAEALADFLSIEGYASDIAIGGAAAKAHLAEGSYDLIVSDLRMPGIDGPALHAWVGANRPDLLPRLAFATGDTLGATAASFLAKVDRPVLEKPFTPDAVKAFLARVEG
jgi:PAS domain S-box-containing protein